MNKQFAEEVLNGLKAFPKRLPSKYFYDKEGDRLFQEIMKLDAYYLTSCEYEIFTQHKNDFLSFFAKGNTKFNLIEFGAGDGYKTEILLEHFLMQGAQFRYVPIDISANVLEILGRKLITKYPALEFKGIQNDYFHALNELENGSSNIVLFLGSNIGNFQRSGALHFLQEVYNNLNPGDMMLTGFDLKKDPATILTAYNDPEGVTRAFNKNLLQRINQELNAGFDPDMFLHYPVYNPESGMTASYLVSRIEQDIEIMDTNIHFDAWESIHTEVSQKYSLKEIRQLGEDAGFTAVRDFTDKRNYFADVLWKK